MRQRSPEMEILHSDEVRIKFEKLMMVDTESRYRLFFQMGFTQNVIVQFDLNSSPASCWGSVTHILETWRNVKLTNQLINGIQQAELPISFQ